MNTYKVRNEEGSEFEVDEDRLEEAEADGYLPVVSNGQETFRVSPADLPQAGKDGYRPLRVVGQSEAVFKGGIKGASGGFIDELSGATEAIGTRLGLKGLGTKGLDEVEYDPEASDEPFGEAYRRGRDAKRADYKEAEEAYPKTFLASEIAGSVGTFPAVSGAKGALATGAVMGLGSSDAELANSDTLELGQAALDTGMGAGAGYAGMKVAEGVSKIPAVGKGILNFLRSAGRGFRQGAQEAAKDAVEVPGVHAAEVTVGALKGVVDELRSTRRTAVEFRAMADHARKILRSGEAGNIGRALSDDEAVLSALLQDGDNLVKDWVANRAAVLYPGQVDADDYRRLLNMSAADRSAARGFDGREAARELKPAVEDTQKLFQEARSERFGQLQREAEQAFDPRARVKGPGDVMRPAVMGVVADIRAAGSDARRLKSISSSVRNLIDDIDNMVNLGIGTRRQGLVEGPLEEVSKAEQFKRLQQARMLLDSKIRWANAQGEGQAEQLMSSLRSSIDDALKTSPEKIEADDLFRSSKDVENRFFKATEFRNPGGGVDIDEGKIKRLLGSTDTAERFKEAIGELRRFSQREDLDPMFRERAVRLIGELEKKIQTADNKRAIDSFRFKQGPSSPAIERMNAVTGKNAPLQDAIRSPAGFLSSADQFMKLVESRTGLKWAQLSPEQRQGAVKLFAFMKANPEATVSQLERAADRFLR